MSRRILKGIAIVAASIAGLFLILGTGLHFLITDPRPPLTSRIIPKELPQRALFVFAHPDDEVRAAGIILDLKRQGAKTFLLTMTSGEKGPTGGIVSSESLGQKRKDELRHSVEILGLDGYEILDYPDSALSTCSAEEVHRLLMEEIDKYRPSIIVTHDEHGGMMAHPDHHFINAMVIETVREHRTEPGFPVRFVYTNAFPRVSLYAQKNWNFVNPGIPEPDFAVPIIGLGKPIEDAVQAHETQAASGFCYAHSRPFWLPRMIYFLILDREYYAIAYDGG